jgi:predicted Rossmann fold nucleotide-binding protein DprA/Smf involved in DNA uptake
MNLLAIRHSQVVIIGGRGTTATLQNCTGKFRDFDASAGVDIISGARFPVHGHGAACVRL